MESGSSDSYDFSFIPRSAGTMDGKVVFTFEDASGEEQTIERPFSFQVMEEMPVFDPGGMMPEELEGGDKSNKLPWILEGIFILICGGEFVWKNLEGRKCNRRWKSMNNRDLISLAFRNLLRRKTRTILAITGVVVGTCAIIVMLSIGFGLSASFQDQIESYGNLHLIDVYRGGGYMGMMDGQATDGILDDKALLAIENIKGVEAVSPRKQLYLTFAIDKHIAQASVVGLKPEILENGI